MRMTHRLLYPLALGCGLLAACGSSGPTVLNISGTGLADAAGKTVKIALVNVGGKTVEDKATTTVSVDKFNATFNVGSDTKYRVDIYVDTDGDGKCQFGVDKVYAVDVNGIGEGKTFDASVIATSFDSRGCLAWGGSSLHVTGSNITATGTVFTAALVRLDGPITVGRFQDSLQNGVLDFTFSGAVVPGKFYRVDLFIDNNHDQHCGAGDAIFTKASDSIGGSQTDGLTGRTLEMAIDGRTDTTTTAACTSFQ